jgi:hypothetical protein
MLFFVFESLGTRKQAIRNQAPFRIQTLNAGS